VFNISYGVDAGCAEEACRCKEGEGGEVRGGCKMVEMVLLALLPLVGRL
jgi:hypothetical protein